MSTADNNWESHADVMDITIEGKTIQPPDGTYADALKLSHVVGANVSNCDIYGGGEDAIDINRNCEHINISDCRLSSGGLYCMTIKGNAQNVALRNIVIKRRGKICEVDLGGWSDQTMLKTGAVILENVTAEDGKPVRVRVQYAERPIVIGGNVHVTVLPAWAISVYRWLRVRNLVP